MLSNTKTNSFSADPELFEDLADMELTPEEVLGDESLLGEVEGLGYVGLDGLGKVRRRRRKAKGARRLRRRARRAGARRRRRRAAKVEAKPRRRRRRKAAAAKMASKAKPRRRRRARRARRGLGSVLGRLANTVESISGLGKARRRRSSGKRRKARRLRRHARKGGVRKVKAHRRRARRARRSSGFSGMGLGRLANVSANLAEVEVAKTMPVVGVFEYLGSMGGLEAIGGVTLSSFVSGVVEKGLMTRIDFLKNMGAPWQAVTSAVLTGITMWEVGRLLGSGNISKYGAFYAFGRAIENTLIRPQVVDQIFKQGGAGGVSGWGLGQARVPDMDELRGLGQARVPDMDELRGLAQARVPDQDELRDLSARVVTEEELLGDVYELGAGEEDSAVF